MGLQSQMTRDGQSRRYMTSRRKSKKGPWVALFALAVAVVGGYIMFYGGADDATGSDAADAPGNGSPDGQPGPAAASANNDRQNQNARQANNNERATNTGRRETVRNPARNTDTQPAQFDLPDERGNQPQLTGEARGQYEQGMQLIEDGRVIEGRAILSELLFRAPGSLPRHEAQAIRDRLSHVNETLVFSDTVLEGDPIAVRHTVQRGEYLSRDIGPAFKTPYEFIMRINGIEDAARVPAGRPIKCIRGPIHARVVKSEYRMDLFVEDPDGLRIYLCSYPVGLGEFDSTPVGLWRIKPRSKVKNPDWRNPRTGEYFERDDPGIPIGEYWMALEGLDENTREAQGYGIHGTNDEQSIGRQESMGCVRMQDQHVEEVFYMLSSGDSRVEILP